MAYLFRSIWILWNKADSKMLAEREKMAQLPDHEQILKRGRAKSRSNAALPKRQRSWQDGSVTDSEPDNGLLVTNINQAQDLMRLQDANVLFAGLKATDGWIQVHGLENMHLTLDDLNRKGTAVLHASDGGERIEFAKEAIGEFESQLYEAIERYDKRLEWLLQDSKKMFGIIEGNITGLLVDASDISCGPRLRDFQRDLLALIDEQLRYMKKLYLASFGTEVSSLWKEPEIISVNMLHEAREWLLRLKPSGGCNLLKALKIALEIEDLDSLVIVVGSCPDQASEILSDYIQQCTVGRNLLVHAVTYDCSHLVPPADLKRMAEEVRGRYHCYSAKRENCDSSDIRMILCERQKAEDLLKIISDIYQGRMSDPLFNIIKEGSMECFEHSSSFLRKPPKHGNPLAIQIADFSAKSSAEWLKTNGLKAKKLSLYQVLAPNAFSPVEDFVPVLQKTVSSTLHEKAMMQFEWHDGTVKNVHIDPPILYDYQKRLGRMVSLYERRIDWLSMASRRIWGTVCERRVVILVDASKTNSTYIIHIQHCLRLLLEQQIASKDLFNIVAFGSEIKAWQPEMVPPTVENLQNAWRWVMTLQCGGTRNVLGALRRALEVDLKDKDKHESQSIYLLTTGIPDQETNVICSYMGEVCGGCDLHLNICLFSPDNFPFDDDVPPRYASQNETAMSFKEIARASGGRFHWFGETGIYESDDIRAILSEIDRAINYSHKCAVLVESLKQRSRSQTANRSVSQEDLMLEKQKQNKPQKMLSPKPTALSLARMSLRDHNTVKGLLWRPPSANAGIPPVESTEKFFLEGRKKKHSVTSKKQPEISLSLFYTDKGKNVGAVYKKYSATKSLRKLVPSFTLPHEQEICSSKKWLSKFSLKKLKLDLPSLFFGNQCVHQKQTVESLQKTVSAKYCDIFPSVEMEGIVKHLQVQPKDLKEYIQQLEQVLRCYVKRIQWLLSGSRQLFGVILEANICILIDTSGSMESSLEKVTKELTSLIWEQLRRNNTRFNLISFAEDAEMWQECLVEATDEACHDATQWVSGFQAHGGTSILKALQRAFALQGVEALYILTDGKPDSSYNSILKEIERLLTTRSVAIHTVSFNRSERGANDFLKNLALQTGGRYHRCHGAVDGQMTAHRLLSEGFEDEDDPVFPQFEGDDLKSLTEEITKARHYLTQAKFFKSLLEKKNPSQNNHLS